MAFDRGGEWKEGERMGGEVVGDGGGRGGNWRSECISVGECTVSIY